MSDVLSPLRLAYGLDGPGADVSGTPTLPEPGGTDGVETETLRQMRDLLDRRPPLAPPAAALDAVRTEAARWTGFVDATAAAVAAAFSSRPRPRPSSAALDAVLARAAEASGLEAPPVLAAGPVEAALVDQSLDALDRLPHSSPTPAVLDAVRAFAAAAATTAAAQPASADASLAPIRSVYEGAPVPAPGTAGAAEAALLTSTVTALDAALSAARPRLRPASRAVDAVLARAAEATELSALPTLSVDDPALRPLAGLPESGLSVQTGVEAAVLRQSLDALDRLPRPAPAPAALDAVRAFAATAAHRPAATGARPSPPLGRAPLGALLASRGRSAWAGAGALLAAAVVAVVLLPGTGADDDLPSPAVAVVQAPPVAEEVAEAVEAASDVAPGEEDLAPLASAAPAAASSGATASSGEVAPAVSRRAVPGPTVVDPPVERAVAQSTRQDRPAEPSSGEVAPAWDGPSDLRVLSLRLEEMGREAEGLTWDVPVEAFGAPTAASGLARTPGLQSVRAGAAPARARLHLDSSRAHR